MAVNLGAIADSLCEVYGIKTHLGYLRIKIILVRLGFIINFLANSANCFFRSSISASFISSCDSAFALSPLASRNW